MEKHSAAERDVLRLKLLRRHQNDTRATLVDIMDMVDFDFDLDMDVDMDMADMDCENCHVISDEFRMHRLHWSFMVLTFFLICYMVY